MTLKWQSSRSRQGYIGLARCCFISKTVRYKIIKDKANGWMTSEKKRQYFIFNIGKSYTFVDVHVKPRSHRPLRRHTTTYDGLISVIADHWGILVCNRATSWCDVARRRSHQGSSRDVLGVCMMFKNLAASPSIVEYRKIILLSRTRSHDVVQRHLTI